MAGPENKPEMRQWSTPHVLRTTHPRPTYVGQLPSTLRPDRVRFDLSIGESPFGPPPQLRSILSDPDYIEALATAIGHYPVSAEPAIDLVRQRFGLDKDPYIGFTSTGSDGILDSLVNDVFNPYLDRGITHYFGVGPQFPDIVKFVDRHRRYTADGHLARDQKVVYGTFFPNLRRRHEQIIDDAIKNRRTDKRRRVIVSVANPSTPPGDVAPIEMIKSLVEFCARKGHILIVDEAFGDVLPDDQSAIPLAEHYPIIVLRSLSKIIGMPGERVGYAVMHKMLGPYYENVQRYYPLVASAQFLANRILDPDILEPHLQTVRAQMKLIKEELMRQLNDSRINYLPTDPRVPILVIDGQRYNLYDRLGYVDIQAAPGLGFFDVTPEFSNQFVRMTIPKRLSAIPQLVRAIHAAIYGGEVQQQLRTNFPELPDISE